MKMSQLLETIVLKRPNPKKKYPRSFKIGDIVKIGESPFGGDRLFQVDKTPYDKDGKVMVSGTFLDNPNTGWRS